MHHSDGFPTAYGAAELFNNVSNMSDRKLAHFCVVSFGDLREIMEQEVHGMGDQVTFELIYGE